jgi:hypothetical protein|tara:strand:- start:599 stop:985 length:387 start_codon:yes stop_codon:yes gene_type:complete
MNWKETYTKVFLKQSDIAITEANVKEYMSVWWQNTRSKEVGGLRLTDKGFLHLTEKLDIQSYDVPFPDDFTLTTSTLIWLDQFITCPYWLGRDHITVMDEKKALELHLFSGDVKKYGLTKALKRTEEH